MSTTSDKRVRKLTPKAMEGYIERVEKFEKQTKKQCAVVFEVINGKSPELLDKLEQKTMKANLVAEYKRYDSVITEFVRYLNFINTQESQERVEELQAQMTHDRAVANDFLANITSSESDSKSNKSSLRSSNSTARIQAAKAKAAFAAQEAELERKQVELNETEKVRSAAAERKKLNLEIDLKLLKEQKELAIVEAELCESEDGVDLGLPAVDPKLRTADYVNYGCSDYIQILKDHDTPLKPTLNNNTATSDFAKYFLKKDLLISRLVVFSDTPESFHGWKSTFSSVISEIGASAAEELDLLIKWLGISSRKQIISLKSAYVHNPQIGLAKAWERLDERFGSPETIFYSTNKKLSAFPKILNKEGAAKLYDLSDILAEVEGLMKDPRYLSTLSYYDSSVGINPIVAKLPRSLQEKWITTVVNYKTKHNVSFPPFCEFSDFVRKHSKIWNDPSFIFEDCHTQHINQKSTNQKGPRFVSSSKTGIESTSSTSAHHAANRKEVMCPIHKLPHTIENCRAFNSKPIEIKRQIIKENKLCFRCLKSDHMIRECNESVECTHCASKRHCSAMHQRREENNGGEPSSTSTAPKKHEQVDNMCTDVNSGLSGKSCTKIILVRVYEKDNPTNYITTYAILDEQSNKSLAKPELFECLNINSKLYEYSLRSCSGLSVKEGRRANNCVIEALDGSVSYDLPTLIECSDIPCNRNEIPTPSDALCYPHLANISSYLPEMDHNAQILLLLGRDIGDVHHVLDQHVGPRGSPYAQQLPLGWVVVGDSCLGDTHLIESVCVSKTYIVGNGRASLLPPCPNKLHIDEHLLETVDNVKECQNTYVVDNGRLTLFKPCSKPLDTNLMYTYDSVFATSVYDDRPSLSVEDRDFLHIMDEKFVLDSNNRWTAPLPFRGSRPELPNNRAQAFRRAKTLETSLNRHPLKKGQFLEFMAKLFSNGHAELAPELPKGAECWYLPIFGVYHPKKPDKIRVVFDSSMQSEGISLNSVLLQGPDLTNSLLGVLIRFRRELVAVSADVEQMFYCFSVDKGHRDFLRFIWYRDNDPSKPLVEYRMCRHVFGNSASPAIATFGLRKAVENSPDDVHEFVHKDFYVDDGLTSCPSASEAVDLLKRTRAALSVTGLRLHKIMSNDLEVMKSFPVEDLAADLNRLGFDHESLPTQRSLGLEWDLNHDSFVFSFQPRNKPVTKRGILSTINSVFDPLGFLAPVVIEGRLILRDVVSSGIDWDDPLPADMKTKWGKWLGSLSDLKYVEFHRSLFEMSIAQMSEFELHICSDASEKAIASVVFLVGSCGDGTKLVSFIMGKAKVAPSSVHTIPRLELCAAVLATELYQIVDENLCIEIASVNFYTDSRVVLGYIWNQSRRFYTYVSNRVQKIRLVSSPQQWQYISTDRNPADVGTRGASPLQLNESSWFSGPTFLCEQGKQVPEFYPLLEPDMDSNVRTNVVVMSTGIMVSEHIGSTRFVHFSSWSKLLMAVSVLVHIASSFSKALSCKGWHICSQSNSVENNQKAKVLILRELQHEVFQAEVSSLRAQKPLERNSRLISLDPFVDEFGLLRVGGRLRQSSLLFAEKHPVVLPSKHHVTKLLLRHCHESVQHQGRLITEGAVRRGGYWIIGGKRAVSTLIFNCVPCKKLRGRFENQKMSDLPVDRVEQSIPFTYVGVDVFGPWQVVTRRTRASQASAKRWAVLFTCLSIRAVHIEVVDEMSSSAFINALRRFISIQGQVKHFRSDRGTNFVGATDHINVDVINVEDETTKSFLRKSGSVWVFNTPHSSHMGGAWERMIGVTRRILDSMLSNVNNLSHDVLVTFLAEASAIVNGRPIVPVSSDPDCPEVLSPSSLLTLKLNNDQQPVGDMSFKNLYKDLWRRVQQLADTFWIRWKREFLQSLQARSKWHYEQTPVKVNDVVLLKDQTVARNHWPLGRICKVFSSSDDRIRKVEVCVIREGKQTFLVRPVVEMVMLVRYEENR